MLEGQTRPHEYAEQHLFRGRIRGQPDRRSDAAPDLVVISIDPVGVRAFEQIGETREAVGQQFIIRVENGNEVAGRCLECNVAGAADAGRRLSNHADARIARQLRRVQSLRQRELRAVVDHDQLEAAIITRENTAHCGDNELRAVTHGDAYGESGVHDAAGARRKSCSRRSSSPDVRIHAAWAAAMRVPSWFASAVRMPRTISSRSFATSVAKLPNSVSVV